MVEQLKRYNPIAGLFGGFFFWYFAHELGFFLSNYNCHHSWILPAIHFVCLIGGLFSGWISLQLLRECEFDISQGKAGLLPMISVAAASIFSVVILWQGIAALVFNGCER